LKNVGHQTVDGSQRLPVFFPCGSQWPTVNVHQWLMWLLLCSAEERNSNSFGTT